MYTILEKCYRSGFLEGNQLVVLQWFIASNTVKNSISGLAKTIPAGPDPQSRPCCFSINGYKVMLEQNE